MDAGDADVSCDEDSQLILLTVTLCGLVDRQSFQLAVIALDLFLPFLPWSVCYITAVSLAHCGSVVN